MSNEHDSGASRPRNPSRSIYSARWSDGLCGVSDGDIKAFAHCPERAIDLLELGGVTQIEEAINLRAVPSQETSYCCLCHATQTPTRSGRSEGRLQALDSPWVTRRARE
jgi:hypothetical protein